MYVDPGALLIVGLFIITPLISSFYVFIGGFVYGLVVSLVFDIRSAFSSGLRASLIGSLLSQLIFVYHVYEQGGWSDCLILNGLAECIGSAAIAVPLIISFYIIAVILSIPFGILGISLGAFIRYIAGIIVGTYKIR